MFCNKHVSAHIARLIQLPIKSSTNSLAWSTGVWGDNVNKCGWDVIKSDTIRLVDFVGVDTKTRWPPEEDVWEDDEDDDWVEKDMHCNMHNCSTSRALHRFLIVAFIAVLIGCYYGCTNYLSNHRNSEFFFRWHQDIAKISKDTYLVPRTIHLWKQFERQPDDCNKSWMSSFLDRDVED